MKIKNYLLAAAVGVVAFCLPASGDQAPWGPVTGRTNIVVIEHATATHAWLSLYSLVPSVSTHSYYVFLSCDESTEPNCVNLFYTPRPDYCNWATLPAPFKATLQTFIGGSWCGPQGHPVCMTSFGVYPSGELYTAETWSCSSGASASNCMSISGVFSPADRITSVSSGASCSN